MPPKRGRDPLDDPKGGPKIRGLQWTGQQPSFLRNAAAALSGRPSSAAGGVGPDGRPIIPTRPEGEGSDGSESDRDEWDLDRGEDAPSIVVLKEGKHLDGGEVERMRAEAKSNNAADPYSTTDSSAAPGQKKTGSLNFASSSTSSRPKGGAAASGGNGDWSDVLKGAGSGSEVKQSGGAAGGAGEKPAEGEKKKLTKEEKAAAKEKAEKKKAREKKVAQKKIAKLSFDDE